MTPRAALLWTAATLAAISTIATVWIQFGGAIPASQLYVVQEDDKIKAQMTRGFRKVEQVDKHQTEESAKLGREIYKSKVRSLLVIQPPEDAGARAFYREQLKEARDKQQYYEDLEIELRKR